METTTSPGANVTGDTTTQNGVVMLRKRENETQQSTEIAVQHTEMAVTPGYGSAQAFELLQRISKSLACSTFMPKDYQGNIGNCMIVTEIASRMGLSPFLVAQNMVPIHGKPSWSATFAIAAANMGGRFEPIKFRFTGKVGSDERTCVAYAKERSSGDVLESTPVSIALAKSEGWYSKPGSKWKTMPEQMLAYRAGSWFVRLYAPECLMGLHTTDEVQDVHVQTIHPEDTIDDLIARQQDQVEDAITEPDIDDSEDEQREALELIDDDETME